MISKKIDWALMPGALVLAAGLGLSLAASSYVRTQLENVARAKFERQAREAHRALEARLTSYTGLLSGMRALYQASGSVSHREFRDYVRSLELATRYSAVRVLNFAEYVTAGDKSAFVRRIRSDDSVRPDGYRDFAIRPPGQRQDYHVLTYMEPFQPYQSVFGMDLFRMPNSLPKEMRTSGKFLSSGTVVRHQSGLPLALRLAVVAPARSGEGKGDGFRGTLGMGFSLVDLMHEAVPPAAMSTMRIRINNIGRVDGATRAPPSEENLLIDTSRLGGSQQETEGAIFATSTRLDFGGALLQLSFDAPTRLFMAPLDSVLPQWVLAAAAAISLLLSAFLYLLARSKQGLERAVIERSQALEDANRVLKGEIFERNRLEREVMHALLEERRSFAQELHDNLGQQLIAASFLIEGLKKDLEARSKEEYAQTQAIDAHMSAVTAQARKLARALNPIESSSGGLPNALQHLAEETRSSRGVQCRFLLHGPAHKGFGDAALDHNLFRLVQHVLEHAIAQRGATEILIELFADAVENRLVIKDNGPIQAEAGADDVGRRVMHYRCDVLGLQLSFERGDDSGTVVSLRWGSPDRLQR